MGLGMLLLALVALTAQARWVSLALIVFGLGFGVYTFGGFSLLIAMTTDREAGAYLGLWSVTILLSRGVGILLGGGLRDLLFNLTANPGLAYALIFGIAAFGLWAAVALLSRVHVQSFARDTGRVPGAESPLIAVDI
jgi:BCD family chlorophyll transporter-like MFS transporter